MFRFFCEIGKRKIRHTATKSLLSPSEWLPNDDEITNLDERNFTSNKPVKFEPVR